MNRLPPQQQKKLRKQAVAQSALSDELGGFLGFLRSQGVVGLAVGFILGGAISDVVSSLVNDIINPILSVILQRTDALQDAVLQVGPIAIKWGHFVAVLIDFTVVAFVVYYGVKLLRLDKPEPKIKPPVKPAK